jgi:hypothetical protein
VPLERAFTVNVGTRVVHQLAVASVPILSTLAGLTTSVVHPRWLGTGGQTIRDSDGLHRTVSPPPPGSAKPMVVSVFPPEGKPADFSGDQRARRSPTSARNRA